jgi:hypothetical protein
MLTEQQQEDLSIIKDTANWPQVVVFPLVNRGKPRDEQCAFLVRGNGPKLYHKNMFELETGALDPQLIGVKTTTFDSFEAMLEAGWDAD